MPKWIERLMPKKPELLPYNYGQPDCPRLKVGDHQVVVSQNEGIDCVAMSCRMSDVRYMKKGKHTRWKVIELFEHDDPPSLLCENKTNRIIDKYLTWSDGNRITVAARPFLNTELTYRAYYEKKP